MTSQSILIVEDEQIVAMDLESMLQKFGYQVLGIVSNGNAAISTAARLHPDLILMDIRLRGPIDGIMIAASIRTQQDVPIVYLTAYSDAQTRERAATTAPYGYLVKPFDERTVQTTIEMALIRHAADRAVRASEQWLRSTLASINDAVVIVDTDAQVTYLNPTAEDMLQVEHDTLLSRAIGEVITLGEHANRMTLSISALQAIQLSEGAPVLTQTTLSVPDGTTVPVEISVAPIQLEPAEALGWVLVIRDIAARLRAETDRVEQQRLGEAFKHMERLRILSGGLAHDLNNLLTGIIGYTELAQLDLDDKELTADSLNHAIAVAQQAAMLTQQMLAYAGRSHPLFNTFNLNSLIMETLDALASTNLKDIPVIRQLDQAIVSIAGDAVQIRQVVLNLLINAAEALEGHGGTITISTGTRTIAANEQVESLAGELLAAGRYVVLEVADTGKGMDAATRVRIFEPFFTTKFTGRGLGLATVIGNVRMHQGTISVSSMPAAGSTFTVLLPESADALEAPPARITPAAQDGRGTILVIDDEPALRGITSRYLAHLGYEVALAEDGQAGLLSFESHRTSIVAILLDLTLPGTSGYAIAHELRKRHSTIPILLMSGYTGDDIAEMLSNISRIGFLGKPFSLHDLGSQLHTILSA